MRNTLFIVSLYLILSACGEKSNEVKFTSEGNPVVMDKFTSCLLYTSDAADE